MYCSRVSEVSGGYSTTSERRADELDAAAADVLRLFRPRGGRATVGASDLTFGQIRLLFLVHREGAVPMGRIATLFGLTSAGASGLVERVERHGLVVRRHRADDRRVVECDLTAKGRRVTTQIAGVRQAELRRTLSVLEADELAEFHRLVRLIVERQARS